MMNFHVMTLFPEMIENAMGESITGRAIKAGHISINAVNIRDYAENKHNRVDDYPYGGGAGMVMQAGPVYRCYKDIMSSIKSEKPVKVIYLSPQGRVFDQDMAKEYSKEENLIFLCGHYEGIDERVLEEIVTDYVSIGDYVLTGGELPALVMMDTISRLVPGVLNNDVSAQTESFTDSLLDYPQYKRPENILTIPVLVYLRLCLRNSFTRLYVSLSIIAGCVSVKIIHSFSGLSTRFLFLKDFLM